MTSFVFGLVQYMFHRRYGHNSLFDWVCEVHHDKWGTLFQESLEEGQQTHSHSHQVQWEELCLMSQMHADWFYWCFGSLPDLVWRAHPACKEKYKLHAHMHGTQ